MTDFNAKIHQIRFRLGLRPRPRWGSLQRSPRPPSWIWGALLLRRGEGREGEDKGGEGRRGNKRGGEGKGHEPPHYLEEVYAYGVLNLLEPVKLIVWKVVIEKVLPFSVTLKDR